MRYPSNRVAWIATLCCALVIAILPKFVTNNYSLSVLAFVAINTILAVGLNLLMGYAGQVSLGHAAFFGMGAYVSAILTTLPHPVSPWLAMLAGVIFTSAVAFAIGIPCLRLKGHYLAMATLGFGWIVYIVLVHWTKVTQGTSGIESIPKLAIGSLVFDNDLSRFYLTWGAALLILLISANVVNSRVGRALRSVHGSEMAATSLGVNISSYKIQVFVLSAAYASIAGSLYAHTVNFISPSSFGFTFSVELVVMVVIGGMASVWGALFGAGTITLLVEWLRSLGQTFPAFRDFDVIAHGAILILVMIFMPSGLTCGAQDLVMHFIRRRRKPALPAVQKPEEVAVK
ncbi:MAG: branched-chain amino acid ABC transporter permease [Armatimonadota bacterium]